MKKLIALSLFCGATLATLSASAATLPPGSLLSDRHTVTVGTGLIGYFSGEAPGTGVAWEVRYAYTPTPILSIEAGYIGGAADAAGLGANVATMFEGGVRINPLRYAAFTQYVNPYVVTGLGYGSFAGTSGGPSDNSTVEMPFGVGTDIRLTDRFTTGGRFTYRAVFGDALGTTRADLDNWQLTARVNAQF